MWHLSLQNSSSSCENKQGWVLIMQPRTAVTADESSRYSDLQELPQTARCVVDRLLYSLFYICLCQPWSTVWGLALTRMEWTSVSTRTRVSVIFWLTRPRATLSSEETKLWTYLAWGQPADPYDVPALEIPSSAYFLWVSLCWVSQLERTVWDFFHLQIWIPAYSGLCPQGNSI